VLITYPEVSAERSTDSSLTTWRARRSIMLTWPSSMRSSPRPASTLCAGTKIQDEVSAGLPQRTVTTARLGTRSIDLEADVTGATTEGAEGATAAPASGVEGAETQATGGAKAGDSASALARAQRLGLPVAAGATSVSSADKIAQRQARFGTTPITAAAIAPGVGIPVDVRPAHKQNRRWWISLTGAWPLESHTPITGGDAGGAKEAPGAVPDDVAPADRGGAGGEGPHRQAGRPRARDI